MNSEGYHDPTAYEALRRIEKIENKFMPIVYVIFNSSKDIENDLNKAREYSNYAISQGCIPISPMLQFPYITSGCNNSQKHTIDHMSLVLLTKCQELWCFGDKKSSIMAKEITKAKNRNMKIRYFPNNCEEI